MHHILLEVIPVKLADWKANNLIGVSKDIVTTGIMRGRIGNKGGVGISLKIAGTTFLFINAHLAGEVQYRFMKNSL